MDLNLEIFESFYVMKLILWPSLYTSEIIFSLELALIRIILGTASRCWIFEASFLRLLIARTWSCAHLYNMMYLVIAEWFWIFYFLLKVIVHAFLNTIYDNVSLTTNRVDVLRMPIDGHRSCSIALLRNSRLLFLYLVLATNSCKRLRKSLVINLLILTKYFILRRPIFRRVLFTLLDLFSSIQLLQILPFLHFDGLSVELCELRPGVGDDVVTELRCSLDDWISK